MEASTSSGLALQMRQLSCRIGIPDLLIAPLLVAVEDDPSDASSLAVSMVLPSKAAAQALRTCVDGGSKRLLPGGALPCVWLSRRCQVIGSSDKLGICYGSSTSRIPDVLHSFVFGCTFWGKGTI
jgi:hypothetical protein